MRTEHRSAGPGVTRARRAVMPLCIVATLIFGACNRSEAPPPTSNQSLANGTYLSEATPEGEVTLVGGALDLAPGGNVQRIEIVTAETGDIDGDEELDAVVVLVEYTGTSHLMRLHALVGKGDEVQDIATRLIGDRVIVRNVRLDAGIIEVDMLVHEPGAPAAQEPTVPITSRFAVTRGGLIAINTAGVKDASAAASETGDGPTLSSHEWILTTIEMGDWIRNTDSLERRPSFRFAVELGDASSGSGTVSGYAGCNQVFGSYSNDETGALRVGNVASTRRLCGEPFDDLEQRVIASVSAARSFEVGDGRLSIDFDGGTMHLSAGDELGPPEQPGSTPPAEDDEASTEPGRQS